MNLGSEIRKKLIPPGYRGKKAPDPVSTFLATGRNSYCMLQTHSFYADPALYLDAAPILPFILPVRTEGMIFISGETTFNLFKGL
jgi:hypothetical protein